MKFTYTPGTRPLDGYTIKRGIGVGGFGEVYFALSDAGKEVALKRIQRNLDIELRGVRQCLNLKHVNLISLWDIRTNDAGEYLIGTGLHRPNLGDELTEVVGPSIAGRYRVENHDGLNRDEHAYLGESPRGVPIWIDRRYVEAELKLAIGLIEPQE